jgi:hypothetical protein
VFFRYRPVFDLQLKAFGYRRRIPAPGRFSPRRWNGTTSDVFLRVTVLPDAASADLEHHYTSGHAWRSDADHPPVEEPLESVLTAELLAQVAAIQADPEAWSSEVVLGLFTPKTDTRAEEVTAEEADFFELGGSVTFDGRFPHLTLRLGRTHDEIVLDHCFEWPVRERRLDHRERLDPPGTPEALSSIEASFGADVAAAAARFHRSRAGRFG